VPVLSFNTDKSGNAASCCTKQSDYVVIVLHFPIYAGTKLPTDDVPLGQGELLASVYLLLSSNH